MISIPAGNFAMGNNSAKEPLTAAHIPERTVSISVFQMSEAEITNEQYATFLNAAMADGLIKIGTGVSMGQAAVFVVGNDGQDYAEQRFIELSGSRVLKDHDGDGTIDPENPLNQCWIEYDEATNQFDVKDPQTIDWDNFPYESGENRANWAELADGNLPSLDEIKQWPVTFIKWYGAYIFAQYYGLDLPTEAEWEYASEGGRDYQYGTVDGTLDATKANYNENNVHPNFGHVVEVKSYPANPFGLYDLAGNVWEWCLDWYDEVYYAENETEDPVNDTPLIGEPIVDDPTCGGAPGQPYTCDTRIKRGAIGIFTRRLWNQAAESEICIGAGMTTSDSALCFGVRIRQQPKFQRLLESLSKSSGKRPHQQMNSRH